MVLYTYDIRFGFEVSRCVPRSLNGEGMFNWRMLFPFEYMDAEKLLVVKQKVRRIIKFHFNKFTVNKKSYNACTCCLGSFLEFEPTF